jgi:hypothetical protein
MSLFFSISVAVAVAVVVRPRFECLTLDDALVPSDAASTVSEVGGTTSAGYALDSKDESVLEACPFRLNLDFNSDPTFPFC